MSTNRNDLSTVKSKWFYPLQHEVNNKFALLYGEETPITCSYQIVTKDRVIEHYTVHTENDRKHVLVEMVKHGKDNHSYFISELNFVASN